jgi:uncharacterized protein
MPRKSLKVVDGEKPWFKDGLSFQCTQCGNCCTGGPGFVWVSDEEIDRLAEHFKLSREETIRQHTRKIEGRLSLKEKRDDKGEYPCVFLTTFEKPDGSTGRGCSIYHVRPLQCRTWPFWDGNLMTPRSWDHAGKKCPGLNKGTHYTQEQIESLRDASDWPDRSVTPTSAPRK